MAASFFCIGSFKIISRNDFVLFGEIMDGEISVNDIVLIARNERHEECSFKISGVEFIDHISEGIAHVGLVYACKDKKELDRMAAMTIENETVMVYSGRSSEQIL